MRGRGAAGRVPGMKTLVTYFSHSGHTAALAHQIALRLGAAEEPILKRDPGGGALSFAGGILDAVLGRPAEVADAEHDPADFDLVVLGTPVWAAGPTPWATGYIDRHRGALPRVALFCTSAGAGDGRALSRLEARLGREAAARLSVTEKELKGEGLEAKLDAFLAALAAPAPAEGG